MAGSALPAAGGLRVCLSAVLLTSCLWTPATGHFVYALSATVANISYAPGDEVRVTVTYDTGGTYHRTTFSDWDVSGAGVLEYIVPHGGSSTLTPIDIVNVKLRSFDGGFCIDTASLRLFVKSDNHDWAVFTPSTQTGAGQYDVACVDDNEGTYDCNGDIAGKTCEYYGDGASAEFTMVEEIDGCGGGSALGVAANADTDTDTAALGPWEWAGLAALAVMCVAACAAAWFWRRKWRRSAAAAPPTGEGDHPPTGASFGAKMMSAMSLSKNGAHGDSVPDDELDEDDASSVEDGATVA